jgi:hypothetical protein
VIQAVICKIQVTMTCCSSHNTISTSQTPVSISQPTRPAQTCWS